MSHLNRLRLLRFLFSIAVLSLSAAVVRAQQPEPPPANPSPPPPDNPPPAPDSGGEDQSGPQFRIGPEVGFYFPSNSKTRDAFGSRFLNIGVGLGTISQKSARGALAFDLSIVTN